MSVLSTKKRSRSRYECPLNKKENKIQVKVSSHLQREEDSVKSDLSTRKKKRSRLDGPFN
jgi:hypothetical protein